MSKSHEKIIEFDASAALNFILDTSNPKEIRAIRLYELQVAIVAGKEPGNSQRDQRSRRAGFITVPVKILSSANILASMKIIEFLERKARLHKTSEHFINDLYINRIFRSIVKRIILTRGGLKKIRYSYRPKQFDKVLEEIQYKRRGIAPIYDYSARFTTTEGEVKSQGGITGAINTLCRVKNDPSYEVVKSHYKYVFCKTDVKKYKRGRDYLAVFCWLEHFKDPYFQPRRTRSTQFATNLIAQASDIDGLHRYIAQYKAARARLQLRGYDVLEFELASSIAPIELHFAPLPDEIAKLKPSKD